MRFISHLFISVNALVAEKEFSFSDIRHRVTLMWLKFYYQWEAFSEKNFLTLILQGVYYKSIMKYYVQDNINLEKNKEQAQYPQIFIPSSSSRFAVYLCYDFQNALLNKHKFTGFQEYIRRHIFWRKNQIFKWFCCWENLETLRTKRHRVTLGQADYLFLIGSCKRSLVSVVWSLLLDIDVVNLFIQWMQKLLVRCLFWSKLAKIWTF
jgi:hypothetical protein